VLVDFFSELLLELAHLISLCECLVEVDGSKDQCLGEVGVLTVAVSGVVLEVIVDLMCGSAR
jgi:hypothetical protein